MHVPGGRRRRDRRPGLSNWFALAYLFFCFMIIPAIFMGLGLFVAFLQAFVFALLTMIYIGLALDEAH